MRRTGAESRASGRGPARIRAAIRVIACGAVVLALAGMAAVLLAAARATVAPANDAGGQVQAARGQADSDTIDPAKVVKLPPGFVLFFTGNWQGHLGPCGCAEEQLGGIDRRTRVFELVPPSRRLLLDAGPLIQQEGLQAQFKLETFLYSLGRLHYDAITLTPREIVAAAEEIGVAPADRPPIVATNFDPMTRARLQTVASVERTLQDGKARLPCLVLGLSLAGGGSPEAEGAASVGGGGLAPGRLGRAIAAVRDMLEQKGIDQDKTSQATLVIALVPSEDGPLLAELCEIKALDVVVRSGNTDEPEVSAEQRSNGAPITVTTGKMGKYIAYLAIPPGSGAALEKFQFGTVAVKDRFVRDPAIVTLLDDYQMQLTIEDLVGSEEKLPRKALDDDNRFVGTKTCGAGTCHEHRKIYEQWRSLAHGRALETLEGLNRQCDPECVRCHSVGMDYEHGYRSRERTPELAGVGCEMCHGPGLNHILDPLKPYRVIFTRCEQCHDPENSPKFLGHREQYFQKIKHWKGRRRYWQ